MEIKPFFTLRPAPSASKDGTLPDRLSPCVEEASADELAARRDRSPANIARVTFPRHGDGEDPYAAAAETFGRWIEQGVLVRERRPAMWAYQQAFVDRDGRTRLRRCLVCLLRLSPYAEAMIAPHERPRPPSRQDRFAYLSTVGADFEPILLRAYGSLEGRLERRRAPEISFEDRAGVRHDAWRIDEYGDHVALEDRVRGGRGIILAGEGRYEAALAHAATKAAEKQPGASFKLAALVDASSSGFEVRPVPWLIHVAWDLRSVRERAARFFEISPCAGVEQAVRRLEQEEGRSRPALVVASPGDAMLLCLRPDAPVPWPAERSAAWRSLDAPAARFGFLEGSLGIAPEDIEKGAAVGFAADATVALGAVEEGRCPAALFTRPPTIEDIDTLASAGEPLPSGSGRIDPLVPAGLFGADLKNPVY
jgi:uncharacterized protein (DUF1015 family)